MEFIIPDAYNAAKYTDKSHEFFLKNARIVRIDFCSDIFLFSAGVNNTILHFAKTKPEETDIPLRVRRWGEKPDDFETNVEILPTSSQIELGTALFKPRGTETINVTCESIELGKICYISVGMVINADEDGHLGVFKTDELLSEILDKKHPKRFALGKDILKWCLRNVRYLEWGTERAPNQFRRQTFPQLQDAKDKLIAMRTPGSTPKVMYDNDRLHFDASSVGFVQWHILQGVRNKSIQKAAKYRDEIKDNDIFPTELREDFERLSQQFNPKYLLAVMNSEFVKQWLVLKRRSKQHIYPDDWKSLPIPLVSKEEQLTIAALAQRCLDAKGVGCEEWEQEIDERVAALYGL